MKSNTITMPLSVRSSNNHHHHAGNVMAPTTVVDYNKLSGPQSTVWKFAKPLFAKALHDLLRSSQSHTNGHHHPNHHVQHQHINGINNNHHHHNNNNPVVVVTQPRRKTVALRVADLGCATGGNSIVPLSFIASQLTSSSSCSSSSNRRMGSSSSNSNSLEVFLGDLPSNPWGTLVDTVTPENIATMSSCLYNHHHLHLFPRTTADDEEDEEEKTTTTISASNCFVYMTGRSFYECCAPPESLDLSFSMAAVHWMKSYAGDIPTGLYATDPLHNTDSKLLQAWKEAGAQDWRDFTQARYQELKVGGRFIGTVACPKTNGHFPGATVGRVVYDALLSRFPSSFPQRDLAACVLPSCGRSRDEVLAGFLNHQDSGCSWDVEVCEFHETKDPAREALDRGDITPTEYAKIVTKSFRAAAHPTILGALTKLLPVTEAERLLNQAYEDCLDVIAANPELYNLDVSFWYVMAQKI